MFLIGIARYHAHNTPYHLPNFRTAVVVLPREALARCNNENLWAQFPRNFQFLHIEAIEIRVGKLLGLRLFDDEETTPRPRLVLLYHLKALFVQYTFYFVEERFLCLVSHGLSITQLVNKMLFWVVH